MSNLHWEYLRHVSEPTLRSFELSRLNHAANLRKEIAALLDQWIEETAAAMLARWLLDNREELRASAHLAAGPPLLQADLSGGAGATLVPAHAGPAEVRD